MREQTVFLLAVAAGLFALWLAVASLLAAHLSTIIVGLVIALAVAGGAILLLTRSIRNGGR